jgi:dipeptidyl aminopeptidase/acylaminoacyl peptidase
MQRSTLYVTAILTAALAGHAGSVLAADAAPSEKPKWDAKAGASTRAGADAAGADWASRELPHRKIPNIPETAEAYYAPDNIHVIAQTQDPKALRAKDEKSAGGALTWIFKDDGSEAWRVNDRGQDACSWFFPDMKRIVWTSTRDNMDMPIGNWSDDSEYPQGAELYTSDLKGGNIKRLTNNKYYEAEVTVSPDGKWIVFGRQIKGNMDVWIMKSDGTGEKQLTFTPDWQEGAPYFLPDSKTILYRAWQRSVTQELKRIREETGQRNQTPMTIFTMNIDGSNVQPRTFTNDMNWAPFPAPDGRHFAYVRIGEGNNWDVYLGDLAGGEPRRLTWSPSFDGFPAISPDGKKLLFTRSEGQRFMSDLYTHVMDISSLNIGPENFKGVPPKAEAPAGWKLPVEKVVSSN